MYVCMYVVGMYVLWTLYAALIMMTMKKTTINNTGGDGEFEGAFK